MELPNANCDPDVMDSTWLKLKMKCLLDSCHSEQSKWMHDILRFQWSSPTYPQRWICAAFTTSKRPTAAKVDYVQIGQAANWIISMQKNNHTKRPQAACWLARFIAPPPSWQQNSIQLRLNTLPLFCFYFFVHNQSRSYCLACMLQHHWWAVTSHGVTMHCDVALHPYIPRAEWVLAR